jgi:uncharacterized protein YcbK (DUF882 family)
MAKISKYFTEAEMECHGDDCCGNTCAMDSSFMALLDKVRDEIGQPMHVNSGFRCNIHNHEIGGVPNSWHTKGMAADCYVSRGKLSTLKDIASQYFAEVIMYDNFVHIGEPKVGITCR